tara:strand:- start:2640 stop:5165 length:2526 start_codon:yes stop_codon:yes gene_type:complete
MSYSNKYTLDFGDVEGHEYRLLIQEKNYTGSVTTPKFGGSPIIIRYEGNDNNYGSIYGSSATIQIYEETPDQFNDLIFTEDKNHRVVLKYYDNQANAYKNYWLGFIVADRLTRTIQQLPNLLTFRAFDGLGLLDQEDQFDPPRTGTMQLNRMIFGILKKLDINGNNDTPQASTLVIYNSNTYFEAEPLYNASSATDVRNNNKLLTKIRNANPHHLTNELGKITAKKQLKNFLTTLGARIYQAQGYWWIDQNAGLLDDNVLEQAINNAIATDSGSGLADLGTKIKDRLENTLDYEVRTWKYSQTTGNYFTNSVESRLKLVPDDAVPLDLKESFEPQIGQINNSVDIKTFRKHQMFTNSGFEYNSPVSQNTTQQLFFNQGWLYRQKGGSTGMNGTNIYGTTANSNPLGIFPVDPPYREPIQGFVRNVRKNGKLSFFTNLMRPSTIVNYQQYTSDSYFHNYIFRSSFFGNRFKITGHYDKPLKISISLFVEMSQIPADFSSGTNSWRCQYKCYLYEYQGQTLNSTPIKMWRRTQTSLPSQNFELAKEERDRQWTDTSLAVDPEPDIFRITKTDYNRWMTFTAEIAPPFDSGDSRADEEFLLTFELMPPFLLNGGTTGSNGSFSTSADFFAQNNTFMPFYKGFYVDNLEIFFEEAVDSPKTFESILSVDADGTINKLSKNINIKTKGTGNHNNDDIATIDNFSLKKFQRPQSVTGVALDKIDASGGLPQAKELPYLINQDLANDYRARLKTYEGKFKVMKAGTKPIFFSDRLWFAWGVYRSVLTNQFNDVVDENVVTINKMTFNPKKNEYTIKGSLSDQKQNTDNTFGDIELLERIAIDTGEGDN